MSLRGGVFLHYANRPGGDWLISRLQSAGPDNLNIPSEKISELGNESSVATVYDTPDLSFSFESFDMQCDMEALLTRVDPDDITPGMEFDFRDAQPLDFIAPWKKRYGTFLTTTGVAVPYLLPESITYRFGVRQSSTMQGTLRGDSIYYCQTTPWIKEFTAVQVASLGVGPYSFSHTGVKTVEQGADVYAYCVTVYHNDGSWDRLVHGTDYTDNAAGFTLAVAPAATDEISVTYASATQRSVPETIHPSVDDKPAAVRGRDVDLVISNIAATPEPITWKGVQTVEATWRVTLDPDEELGNPHYVARDYDVPEVSGSVVIRPVDATAFYDRLAQLQDVTSSTQTLNTTGFVPMDMEIQVNHPDTGARLKTVVIDDARFTPPPIPPRVGQKADFTLAWTSDGGHMKTYAGERP